MPQMTEPRELFMHELGDILYAENMLVKALPKMAKEAADEELSAGFTEHLEQTRGQVDRIKKAFQALGESPKAEQCPGIEGIIEEQEEFMSENDPSPGVRDLFLTGAGARTEHYEIAAYSGLVAMARALGERECVNLLTENLREEKETLKSLERAARRLSKEQVKASKS
jgi:ferritin-like metal-binding protein YciE